MDKTLAIATVLALFSVAIAPMTANVTSSSTIYIRPDGSVDPASAPIHRNGDIYTFTDNIYETIDIQKSGIKLDGAGYSMEGTWSSFGLYLNSVTGVTMTNLFISGFKVGIRMEGASYNTIVDSVISGSRNAGIAVRSSSNGNVIIGNEIFENNFAIYFMSSSDNVAKENMVYDHRLVGIRTYNAPNSVICENTITDNADSGIYLRQASDSIVKENIIMGNGGYGINVYRSSNSIIKENTISENGWSGIQVGSGVSDYVTGNIIKENTILDNEGHGINLYGAIGNVIAENMISMNDGKGIRLVASWWWSSDKNIITGNTISENGMGFYLDEYASKNLIYHNNIMKNAIQVQDEGSNMWDDGSGEGNHWSDYKGKDLDGDGIGDTKLPHQDVDWCPLIEPC
jgi:parallel beta-helix repeat protein